MIYAQGIIDRGLSGRLGLKSWSLKHPLQTEFSMAGNVINSIQSARPEIEEQAPGALHLIATAVKQN